jgi:hypothetical protein
LIIIIVCWFILLLFMTMDLSCFVSFFLHKFVGIMRTVVIFDLLLLIGHGSFFLTFLDINYYLRMSLIGRDFDASQLVLTRSLRYVHIVSSWQCGIVRVCSLHHWFRTVHLLVWWDTYLACYEVRIFFCRNWLSQGAGYCWLIDR